MTVTDVAFGSAWPRRVAPPPRWMTAAFAVSFAAWGLVAGAVYFAGAPTYEAIARESGFATTTRFLYPPGDPAAQARPVDLAALIDWHERWSAYVLGRSADPLAGAREPAFTPDEVSHMADVRRVFIGAQAVMAVGAAVCIVLFGLALRRGAGTAGLVLRNGGAISGGVVLVVAIVAAVAFEPAFLAFHYVLFPQGNFLFPPESNLIRLYPEPYWYGVTLRVGGAFIAVAVATSLVGWLLARSARVTPR